MLVALGMPLGLLHKASRASGSHIFKSAASPDFHRNPVADGGQDSLLRTVEKSCETLQLWTYVTAQVTQRDLRLTVITV